MSPEEAARAHRALRAEESLGVHWGTFQLSDEGRLDPLRDLRAALRPGERFYTLAHADVILSIERHLHTVELSVRAEGERYAATVESEDMYASIDLVVDKVDRQVRDAKDEATARMKQSGGVTQLSGKRGGVPR